MVVLETKVCHVIKLWTSFQKKLNSRLLVQEEHSFQKGAQCAPLAAGSPFPNRLAFFSPILLMFSKRNAFRTFQLL